MQSKARDLFGEAAQALAGKPVIVRRRPPCWEGCDGLAMLDRAGKAYIDIDPALRPARLLEVFAHECAHVKLGHPTPSDWPTGEPRSLKAPGLLAIAAAQPKEDDAGRMAGDWLAQAELHAKDYPGDWLTARLAALADLPYRRAVSRGVDLALSRLPKR